MKFVGQSIIARSLIKIQTLNLQVIYLLILPEIIDRMDAYFEGDQIFLGVKN